MDLGKYMRDRVTMRQFDRSRVGTANYAAFQTPVGDPRWITRDEAAELAGRATNRTIDRWVDQGLVTVYRGPVPPHPNSGKPNTNGVLVWRDDVLEQAGKVDTP